MDIIVGYLRLKNTLNVKRETDKKENVSLIV